MWKTYVQLWEVEAAFRIHRVNSRSGRSGTRSPSASSAHPRLLPGHVLWKTLEHWQAQAGLGNSPRRSFHELARIQSTDVVLPLAG